MVGAAPIPLPPPMGAGVFVLRLFMLTPVLQRSVLPGVLASPWMILVSPPFQRWAFGLMVARSRSGTARPWGLPRRGYGRGVVSLAPMGLS